MVLKVLHCGFFNHSVFNIDVCTFVAISLDWMTWLHVCVQSDIYDVIRQVFTAATSQPPPKGIGHSPQSRSVYGIDVMLQWKTAGDSGKSLITTLWSLSVACRPDQTTHFCVFSEWSVGSNLTHNHYRRFVAIIQVNLYYPAPPVENWRILLVESLTACKPLLSALTWQSTQKILVSFEVLYLSQFLEQEKSKIW